MHIPRSKLAVFSISLLCHALICSGGDFTGAQHSTFLFNTPLTAQQLIIEIDMPIEQTFNVGIDNLVISQSVPEPGAVSLIALLSLAALGVRRRAGAAASINVI